jgi:hypothetical protein
MVTHNAAQSLATMNWLEISRTPDERPRGWRVGECLWSPRRKEKNGAKGEGTKWGFWETMLDVRRGDVVFHLCGKREPLFTGFSTASEDGHPVDVGPHGPEKLYRVALQDFTPFDVPFLWKTILGTKERQLRDYFHINEDKKGAAKERLFYVLQNGKLQCLNGAYLSHLSGTLTDLLFGIEDQSSPGNVRVIAPIRARAFEEVWWLLEGEHPERATIVKGCNTHVDFFQTVRPGLFTAFVIVLSSIFDEHRDAVSLKSVPGITVHPAFNPLWAKGRLLYRYRSKAVAHRDKENEQTDFAAQTGLSYNELRGILKGSVAMFDHFAAVNGFPPASPPNVNPGDDLLFLLRSLAA